MTLSPGKTGAGPQAERHARRHAGHAAWPAGPRSAPSSRPTAGSPPTASWQGTGPDQRRRPELEPTSTGRSPPRRPSSRAAPPSSSTACRWRCTSRARELDLTDIHGCRCPPPPATAARQTPAFVIRAGPGRQHRQRRRASRPPPRRRPPRRPPPPRHGAGHAASMPARTGRRAPRPAWPRSAPTPSPPPTTPSPAPSPAPPATTSRPRPGGSKSPARAGPSRNSRTRPSASASTSRATKKQIDLHELAFIVADLLVHGTGKYVYDTPKPLNMDVELTHENATPPKKNTLVAERVEVVASTAGKQAVSPDEALLRGSIHGNVQVRGHRRPARPGHHRQAHRPRRPRPRQGDRRLRRQAHRRGRRRSRPVAHRHLQGAGRRVAHGRGLPLRPRDHQRRV